MTIYLLKDTEAVYLINLTSPKTLGGKNGIKKLFSSKYEGTAPQTTSLLEV